MCEVRMVWYLFIVMARAYPQLLYRLQALPRYLNRQAIDGYKRLYSTRLSGFQMSIDACTRFDTLGLSGSLYGVDVVCSNISRTFSFIETPANSC